MTAKERDRLIRDFKEILDTGLEYADKHIGKVPKDKTGGWSHGCFTGFKLGAETLFDRMMFILHNLKTIEEEE